jgi:4-coumarate--CoA ligase
MFAAMFLGVTLYPITPIANVYELDQLMDTLGPLFVFTSTAKSAVIENIISKRTNERQMVRFVSVLDNNHIYVPYERLLDEGSDHTLDAIPYFAVKPKKDIAILMQSSGTSGVPKSVMISHKAFVATLTSFIKPNDDGAGKSAPVSYQMTQFSCMSGLTVLFGYAICGVTQVIADETDDQSVLKAIETFRVNFLGIVPAFGHKLICGQFVDTYDLSSLKALVASGASFPANVGKQIIQKYRVPLLEGIVTAFDPLN